MRLETYGYFVSQEWDKPFSPPPVIDLERAEKARMYADYWLNTPDFPALTSALTLAVYNFDLCKDPNEREVLGFLDRFYPLAIGEMNSARRDNPLPTIGIEIEIPQKPLNYYLNIHRLPQFVNMVGLPRNRANVEKPGFNKLTFWEFSTEPSYDAAVQARILSELIKGGLIASLSPQALESSTNIPRDIRQYLSDPLVSMHINLGFPSNSFSANRPYQDANILGQGLALAFTSPPRLEHRKMWIYTDLKKADPTRKIPDDHQRLEMKAMEVATSKVYRNIITAQLLGAALMAERTKGNPILAESWRMVRNGIDLIFEEFGIDIKEDEETNKSEVANIVRETKISQRLRSLFTYYAVLVRQVIDSNYH